MPALSAAAVEVDGLRIRHEGRTTWTPDGATFSLTPGVTLLLGPSGSGKSTLALALNGLIPHALAADLEGGVSVAGLATRDRTVAQLSTQVAMVFQDPDTQLVTGSLIDEVCFGPENLGLPVDQLLARGEHALRAVGLWDRRHENPDRLSGGGKQRLAIACAVALQTPVLVLDEPTANLDPAGIEEVYRALGELVASGERSILLIEHNLDAAVELVDRVIVLDRAGRVSHDGPVREILRDRAAALQEEGVWLPVATLAALQLRSADVVLDPLPLTPAELARGLADRPSLPALAAVAAADAPDDVVITVDDLRVVRGRTEVLHGVALEVHRGDFVAVVGVNGAGKTTLVQAIAGVVPPPKGRVAVAGLDPARADVRELSRAIGFVFQNPEHQFITGTVFDELAHGLRIRGVDETEVVERVERMLERFGLAELRTVHPFLLSGGQKRRLSVGTALIGGAPVLALDEPTFGQDRERAAELLGILQELNRDGTTVIVVTHDMQLVADYSSRLVVMKDGSVLAAGATGELLADRALIEEAGLRPPPLAQALGALDDPAWRAIARRQDLPGAATTAAGSSAGLPDEAAGVAS